MNDTTTTPLRIFISYSSKDAQIAEKIEKYLNQQQKEEEPGYSTWRDKRRIEADWSNEIAWALTKQDIILLLWTENAFQSDYVKSEWMTARALGKVIKPMLFTKDFPSLHLPKPLVNVQAIADLERVADVEKNIHKLLVPLNLLGKERTPLTSKYDYNLLPAKHQIPFLPNPDFVGRADELVNLYLDVIGGLNKLNYAHVGIVGIGGVGKTQLAVEFTYRYAFQFEKGIYWIQGADQSKWLSQIVWIARDLGLDVSSEDEEINREKNYFHAFNNYCKEYGSRILLIIDNVEDPQLLNNGKNLFPSDPNVKFRLLELECNILFTTRRDFILPGAKMYFINLLSPESSLDLMTRYRKSARRFQQQEEEEENYARMICNAVGYLPLALVLIQAYLRKYQDVSFKDYYEEFKKNRMSSIDLDEISEDDLATRHAAAIRSTLDQDWKILEKASTNQNQVVRNQNSKKLLFILSLFPESALVPKGRLIIFSGIDRYGKTKLVRPAESSFVFLDELNLIDLLDNGKAVRIHPLLREYVLEKQEGDSAENQSANLKAESIFNLKRTYYDNFSSLVQEYVERNGDIDSIREDFGIALSWSKKLASTTIAITDSKVIQSDIRPIHELSKIIDQESHNLRLTETSDSFSINQDKQVLLAQSMLIRSFDLNHMELANKSREFLRQLRKPFLDIRWARVRSKGAQIRTLKGHSDSVESVAITSDNSKIVSGSGYDDKTVKVWDLNTGKLLKTLKGHSNDVNSVAITLDSNKIVSGSGYDDNTIKVWDMDTGELLKTLKGHSSHVQSVTITSDSSKIVSGSGYDDNTIKVWDMDTGELLKTLKGHSSHVQSVTITSDSSKIVSGSGYDDNTIKVWDMDTDELPNTLEGHSLGVNSIAITTDNSKVVSGFSDSTVKVWDMNTGKLLKTLKGHSSHVNSVAITSDSSKIVSGSEDRTIKVWDLNTGKLLKTLEEGHSSNYVISVAITSDNSKIVSGFGPYDNTIKVWDLNTGKLLKTFEEDHSLHINSVPITSDNSKVVSGSSDSTVKVWDMNTGKLLKTLKGHSLHVNSVAITSDNSKIVSGSSDYTIKVWDLNSGKLLKTLKGHSLGVNSVAITSDSSKIVSGSEDRTIKVWVLPEWKCYLSDKFDAAISSIAFSKSKNLIILGDSTGNLYAGTLYT